MEEKSDKARHAVRLKGSFLEEGKAQNLFVRAALWLEGIVKVDSEGMNSTSKPQQKGARPATSTFAFSCAIIYMGSIADAHPSESARAPLRGRARACFFPNYA